MKNQKKGFSSEDLRRIRRFHLIRNELETEFIGSKGVP